MKKKTLMIIIILICALLFLTKAIVNFMYPNKYAEYVEEYANRYNVDVNLVYAIIKQESNFETTAISSKGAIGLMQLMKSTAADMAKTLGYSNIDLNDPEINIMLGTKYLSVLIEKYSDFKLAIAAYNAGSGNVDTWIENGIINSDGSNLENIPYKETSMYVRKVLNNYMVYSKLYC